MTLNSFLILNDRVFCPPPPPHPPTKTARVFFFGIFFRSLGEHRAWPTGRYTCKETSAGSAEHDCQLVRIDFYTSTYLLVCFGHVTSVNYCSNDPMHQCPTASVALPFFVSQEQLFHAIFTTPTF
jgi:hypothetical protein